MIAAVLVLVGGAVGAALRAVMTEFDRRLPYGLIAANVSAAAVLGLVEDLDQPLNWLVATGFLGALSTWSSLALVTVDLWMDGDRGSAVTALAATVLGSILVVAVLP